MENKIFSHDGINYTLEYEDGRPDKHAISFLNSTLGLTQKFRFRRLVIDVDLEKITTWYDIQLFAANGDRVIHPDTTKNEKAYVTSGLRYLQWIGLMGPILMPMLSDNISEDLELPKQYEDVVIEIAQGLTQLSSTLDV